jgi:hypothetical protein
MGDFPLKRRSGKNGSGPAFWKSSGLRKYLLDGGNKNGVSPSSTEFLGCLLWRLCPGNEVREILAPPTSNEGWCLSLSLSLSLSSSLSPSHVTHSTSEEMIDLAVGPMSDRCLTNEGNTRKTDGPSAGLKSCPMWPGSQNVP